MADWTAFAPHPYENGAYIDVFTSYERDHYRSQNARARRWDDIFIREKLTLFSTGYSYDPRFLTYQVSVAGALRQEHYDASYLPSGGWDDSSGIEYDARFTLLPEHPYNLSAFATRYEPLFKEQASTQHNAVGTTYGASFRYRQKPYFVHVGYVDTSIDSGTTSSDVSRVNVDGQYFKRFANGNEVSVTGNFNPSWFSNSADLDGDSMQYSLGNMVNLWHRVRLNSNVSRDEFDQDSPVSGHFTTDQLAWYELLTIYLPWNLRTDFAYRYRDNRSTLDPPGPTVQHLSDSGDTLQLDLTHRLYESLDTRYTFLRITQDYSGGDSSTLGHALTMNYSKSIPYGRLLAGGSFGRGDTDTSGAGAGVSDAFPGIDVPGGTFVLRQQNIDPDTISVYLKSPLPPFQFILLAPTDYVVEPALNTYQIRILTIPAEFVVPGTYDFLAFYTLTDGDFELRTDTASANISSQLFDNLVTPYFNYVRVTSDVLDGVFPGTPVDSTTYTTGLILYRAPLRLLGEYQNFDANIAPYESWRGEAQCVAALTVTLDLYATASYTHKRYPRGTSGEDTPPLSQPYAFAYSEDITSVSSNIQKRLPDWNMTLAGGGTYSHISGLADTDAYSLNGSWTWRIGKVDASLGVTAYAADTSGTQIVSTKRDHQFVYLNLRRRLF